VRRFELIVIGASWGGLAVLRDLLAGLPRGFATPIVIAQHRSPDSLQDAFVDLLASYSALPVVEASDKERIEPGRVYIAPTDYHLLVEGDSFALTTDERVNFARPSIDELFETACDSYGSRVIGVVLTGANEDGAAGLACIAARGGVAIVQDPEGAERPEMPQAALDAVPTARVLPLGAIADELVRLCEGVVV
jgi:two-component system, chemotaxis family, protein-glutamate methylesterase/glutaminase